MPDGSPSTWLEIHLGAFRHNISLIQSITGRPVMPVIKANGYGHGIVEVGRAAAEAGAAWLGVARLEEAVALRQAGIHLPLLVMGFCMPDLVPEALRYRVSLAIHQPENIIAFAERARASGQVLNVHAKIDTGMGRLGVFPEEGMAFVRAIRQSRGL